MLQFLKCAVLAHRCKDYRPASVSTSTVREWLRQFDNGQQRDIVRLFKHIRFLSEDQTRRSLIQQNDILISRLREVGIAYKNLIYVQIHDAGSSSPAILNMLKDHGRLEKLGCRFADSRDALGLNKLTNEVAEGALIYVDDFIGTATQFCEARDFAWRNVVGTFSEFLLAPCICEEALYKLGARSIEAVSCHVHTKAERPLHEHSTLLEPPEKKRLRELCLSISAKGGLGYQDLSTMVIFYRNSPNTTPSIFRGHNNQRPLKGLFPRTTDLPRRVPEP
jgi:hypothetical protein